MITILDNDEESPPPMESRMDIFQCKQCAFCFPNIVDLSSHIEVEHYKDSVPPSKLNNKECNVSNVMEEVTCRECLFEADSGENLKIHLNTHKWM